MRFFSFLLAALFLVATPLRSFAQSPAVAPSPPAFAEKISLPGLPNAAKVSDQLFRGAQPELSSLPRIKSLGVTTIVSLRRQSPHGSEDERQRAESLGLRFVQIPVGGFSTPSPQQLAQFFKLVRETPPQKIFVHCEYGEDRTGVFVAAYRIAFQHWTAEQAIAEMYAFGFHNNWHPNMEAFVRELPARLQSDPTLKAALPTP
jgi:protein tyrosine/serine phosphatase